MFMGVEARVRCLHRFFGSLFRHVIWERRTIRGTKKLISPQPRRGLPWFFLQKVDINEAQIANQSHAMWIAMRVLQMTICAIFVKVQTVGKLGEDDQGAQMWGYSSVHHHHGHVFTYFGGRGGWHGEVVSWNMVFWGGCLGCWWWVYYHFVVVYQNRSFLFDCFPHGKGGEWTFSKPCSPPPGMGKRAILRKLAILVPEKGQISRQLVGRDISHIRRRPS